MVRRSGRSSRMGPRAGRVAPADPPAATAGAGTNAPAPATPRAAGASEPRPPAPAAPGAGGAPPAAGEPRPRGPVRRLGPLLVPLVAAGMLFWIATSWNAWVGAQRVQKTDDAQLRADITPLSTKVSGSVVRVAVADYQRARAGDLLVERKSTDLRAQVAEAEAGAR